MTAVKYAQLRIIKINQTVAPHHNAFDLCRSNECKVQRLPFLTFDAISSTALDLQHAYQKLCYLNNNDTQSAIKYI